MKFKDYGLFIISDFEIRTLREDEEDIDFLIPLNNRPLNLIFCNMPDYLDKRFQFTGSVYGILIRISKFQSNQATIHILKNIDLNSSFLNFEICYDSLLFKVIDCVSFVELVIED